MSIAYIDAHTGRERVINLVPGIAAAQAAKAFGLAPGAWREITYAEAAELQKPTPEEIAAQEAAIFKNVMRAHLDAYAKELGYDDVVQAASCAIMTKVAAGEWDLPSFDAAIQEVAQLNFAGGDALAEFVRERQPAIKDTNGKT